MNKKTWITILLDDTLSDEEIMSYVQESYDLTKRKIERKEKIWFKYYGIKRKPSRCFRRRKSNRNL